MIRSEMLVVPIECTQSETALSIYEKWRKQNQSWSIDDPNPIGIIVMAYLDYEDSVFCSDIAAMVEKVLSGLACQNRKQISSVSVQKFKCRKHEQRRLEILAYKDLD